MPALPSPLLVMRPDERLAMVRTVRTAYGTEGRRGGKDDRQHEALPFWLLVDRWRGGGDGIHPEPGRVPALPSPLLVVRPDERLAMAWTVEASDGTEERRGTGEEVGGILRPGSLSSFPSACFCFSSIYNQVYIII